MVKSRRGLNHRVHGHLPHFHAQTHKHTCNYNMELYTHIIHTSAHHHRVVERKLTLFACRWIDECVPCVERGYGMYLINVSISTIFLVTFGFSPFIFFSLFPIAPALHSGDYYSPLWEYLCVCERNREKKCCYLLPVSHSFRNSKSSYNQTRNALE